MKLIIFLVTIAICFFVIFKDFSNRKYYRPLWALVFLFTNGLQIIPSPGGTLSYVNFGLVAMVLMYFMCFHQHIRIYKSNILKWYKYFIFYFVACVLFSLLYYNFAPFEVLRAAKSVIPFASVFLFGLLNKEEIEKMFYSLLKITVALNVLYIVQIFTGLVILTYHVDSVGAGDGGLYRFYNKPILSTFFLLWLIFQKGEYKNNFRYFSIGLMFASLFLSQNRLEIVAVVIAYLVCSLIQKRKKIGSILLQALLLIVLYLPVSMVFSMRDSSSTSTMSTKEDVMNVVNGGYKDMSQGDGTFTFRFAMLYERMDYMAEISPIRQIFGLGLGQSEYVEHLYHFQIGTLRADRGVSQLNSADFAWIGMICWWGYGGTIIFLIIFCKMMRFYYRYRVSTLSLISFGYMLYLFIGSFAGSWMADAQYYLMPFIAMFYQYHLNAQKTENESSTYRIGIG